MANSRGSAEGTFCLDPRHAQRLRRAVPNLDDWPRSWHVEPADIVVGEQIVQLLTPFLLHLLEQGLAKATVSRHRDNLWTLGGELIRRRYDDDDLANKPVKAALCQLFEGDEGPLIWPRITKTEQDSVDATCRKLVPDRELPFSRGWSLLAFAAADRFSPVRSIERRNRCPAGEFPAIQALRDVPVPSGCAAVLMNLSIVRGEITLPSCRVRVFGRVLADE